MAVDAVHPRGRGEHIARAGELCIDGSSPRARGTPCRWSPDSRGSSPRARGTRQLRRAQSSASRFIPAGAGNTQPSASEAVWRRFIPAGAGNTSSRRASLDAVHPRGRGEHSGVGHGIERGSSPRARGTPSSQTPAQVTVHPRGRGEHVCVIGSTHARRFIPAGAGNTASQNGRIPVAVHPRGRGEHPC